MRKQAEKIFFKIQPETSQREIPNKKQKKFIRKQAGKNNFSKKPKCQPQLKIGAAYRRSLCPPLVSLCMIFLL
jgi:hypothetical protein